MSWDYGTLPKDRYNFIIKNELICDCENYYVSLKVVCDDINFHLHHTKAIICMRSWPEHKLLFMD